MEKVCLKLLGSFEHFEDYLRKCEGRGSASSPEVHTSVTLLKELMLKTDFPTLCSVSDPTVPLPKSAGAALKSEAREDWREKLRAEWFRMYSKFHALIPVDWDEMVLENGKHVGKDNIPNMIWVLAHKYHADGSFNRRKGRLCAAEP